MADYTLIRDQITGKVYPVEKGKEEAFFAEMESQALADPLGRALGQFTQPSPSGMGPTDPMAEALGGLGAVAAGSTVLGPWAYRGLPEEVRAASEKSWEEYPWLSGAVSLGTGILGGGLERKGLELLGKKGLPYVSSLAQKALNYPAISALIQGAAQGAESGDPLQAASQGAFAGALTKGAQLGSRASVPYLGVEVDGKRMPKETPDIMEMQKYAANVGLSPEDVAQMAVRSEEFLGNVPSAMQSEVPLGFTTGGNFETQAINLASQQVPATQFLRSGGKGGRLGEFPEPQGETVLGTPMQRATQEILGLPEDVSVRAAQERGLQTLEESGRLSQKAVDARNLYEGLFEDPTAVRPQTPEEIAAQRANIRRAEEKRLKEQELFGKTVTKVPELKTTKTITQYSPEIENLSQDPVYKRVASALGIPQENLASQDSAKRVLSELREVIKGKKYAGTELASLQPAARQLQDNIKATLLELNPKMAEADVAYGIAKTAEFGLDKKQRETVRKALGLLNSQGAGVDVGDLVYKRQGGAGGLDVETFKGLVDQVKKRMGPQGINDLRDSVSTSILRDINQASGEKVLSAVFPGSKESLEKLSLLYGAKEAKRINDQINTLRALKAIEGRAVGNSKTGELSAAEKLLKVGDSSLVDGFVNNLKAAGSNPRLAKRLLADYFKKKVGASVVVDLDKNNIADFLFTKGMAGPEKLRRLASFMDDMKKGELKQLEVDKMWLESMDKITNNFSRNLVRSAYASRQQREE